MSWLAELIKMQHGDKEVRCPFCGQALLSFDTLKSTPKSSVGYAILWCKSCKHGKLFSRYQFSEDEAATLEHPPEGLIL